jgi:S1-C subfamily serine protease
MQVERPEQLPSLTSYKAELDYDGQVVRSCIHCHMIRDAERKQVRAAGEPLSDELLYPYPNPKVLGLVLDPKQKAVVAEVVPGSQAAKDGFRAGDEIVTLAGQPLLSIADVQWVLHTAPAPTQESPTQLPAEVVRNGQKQSLSLTLASRWRKHDISWRPTTWELRRMAGGMLLEDMPDEERKSLGLASGTMALRAKHVGQYGEHAVAKRAGFLKDDLVLAIDGASDRWTETDFLEQVTQHKKPGDSMTFKIRRGKKTLELSFKLQ